MTATLHSMPVSAEALRKEAERVTGLSDWGGEEYSDSAFRALLDSMVRSLNGPSALNEQGAEGAKSRLAAVLEARLAVIRDRRADPGLASTPIVRPIFIMGLPRTGSSFLQNLMAQDPALHSPLTWEMMLPSPPPGLDDRHSDPRIGRAEKIYRQMGLMNRAVQELHPFDVRAPDEDHSMMEILLLGDQLLSFWRMPDYIGQRAQTDPLLAFSAHRMVLENLHSRHPGKQVVLKNPGHFLHLPELIHTYPDALFIQTHRDPVKVIPSVARLVVELRRASSTETPPLDKIARGNLTAFAKGLDDLIDARSRGEIRNPIIDIQFRDLIRDPLGAVRTIYAQFDLPLSSEALQRMSDWLERDNVHASRIRHDLASCGLTVEDIDNAFGPYMRHYEIPPER